MVGTLMRQITSLMFALDADQATRLNHYVKNEAGEYDLANVSLGVVVMTKGLGRFETLLENIEITRDEITQNIALTLHLVDKDNLREAMIGDNRIFNLDLKFSPRTQKVSFIVRYDGCPT